MRAYRIGWRPARSGSDRRLTPAATFPSGLPVPSLSFLDRWLAPLVEIEPPLGSELDGTKIAIGNASTLASSMSEPMINADPAFQ
jgi:hypothetical protein